MFNFFLFVLMINILISGYFVITFVNPINALLSLISCFALSSLLLCCFNLNFFAIIFILIYIGAISVFFLFIIMFININKTKIKNKSFYFILFVLVFFFIKYLFFFVPNNFMLSFDILFYINYLNSIEILALFLYNFSVFFILFIAIFLFIAMLGCILLLTEIN